MTSRWNAALATAHANIIAISADAERAVRGKAARIVTDWNSQPYGNSKRSRKGEVHVIRSVHFDSYCEIPSILLEGFSLYIGLDEIEILEE